VLGHVSFPKELPERRLRLFVNTVKLKHLSNKLRLLRQRLKSNRVVFFSQFLFLLFCCCCHFIVLECFLLSYTISSLGRFCFEILVFFSSLGLISFVTYQIFGILNPWSIGVLSV